MAAEHRRTVSVVRRRYSGDSCPALPALVEVANNFGRVEVRHRGVPCEGGSATGLSAIGARTNMPMILSTWGFGTQIASFFLELQPLLADQGVMLYV